MPALLLRCPPHGQTGGGGFDRIAVSSLLRLSPVDPKGKNAHIEDGWKWSQKRTHIITNYYRFHKNVGKGFWSRYRERYVKPTDIENRLPIYFPNTPRFEEAKMAHQWKWKLPKRIAMATDANGVLEAWNFYRHKRRKKPFHFLLALKRLVQVGSVDPTDFRFRLIAGKLWKGQRRRMINLPRAALLLARLKATADLFKLSKHFHKRIERYSPRQLGMICYSMGSRGIHDKHLFNRIAARFMMMVSDEEPSVLLNPNPEFHTVAVRDLLNVTEAFAVCQVHHYPLFGAVSLCLQRRLAAVTETESAPPLVGAYEPQLIPNLPQLALFATAFAKAKFRDFSFFDVCSAQLQHALRGGSWDDGDVRQQPHVSPHVVAQVALAFDKCKIVDPFLLETILSHMRKFIFDYRPSDVAAIASVAARSLPPTLPHLWKTHLEIADFLEDHADILSLDAVERAATFALAAAYMKRLHRWQSPQERERLASEKDKKEQTDSSEDFHQISGGEEEEAVEARSLEECEEGSSGTLTSSSSPSSGESASLEGSEGKGSKESAETETVNVEVGSEHGEHSSASAASLKEDGEEGSVSGAEDLQGDEKEKGLEEELSEEDVEERDCLTEVETSPSSSISSASSSSSFGVMRERAGEGAEERLQRKVVALLKRRRRMEPLVEALSRRVVALRNDGRTVYDVPKVLETLCRFNLSSGSCTDSFEVLCKHIHRHLDSFEPHDFARAARAMNKVASKHGYVNEKAGNALVRHVSKRCDEFGDDDLWSFIKHMKPLGVSERDLRRLNGKAWAQKQQKLQQQTRFDVQLESMEPGGEEPVDVPSQPIGIDRKRKNVAREFETTTEPSAKGAGPPLPGLQRSIYMPEPPPKWYG
uniref:Uncharacterized protein n=1 Tax=Chromera velia CCMP2878 TaxID=1169474 RepID=A0A0G4F679_9ALVE|eukprot:Cvel_15252.t1-p1 / transcript=Cvel_15252.t1 / gene=Cvel_15252 / organism=Chromera_velia_CCMP2878 / gene_product=hypothetical protein / transcript_product=hypothetical protein / location=Cvel_scaffold1117:36246-44715(+) / protein_length=872 / sequence_SO=supercontig / SO=protein_coding / is_pseudo=false